jgi:hypothetical protein
MATMRVGVPRPDASMINSPEVEQFRSVGCFDYMRTSCWRQPLTPHQTELPEHTMFAYLMEKLGNLLEQAEHGRRDDYLSSSADICELERRIRSIEIDSYTGWDAPWDE